MVVLAQKLEELIIGAEGKLVVATKTDFSHRIIEIPPPLLPPNLTKGQEEVIKNGNKIVTCICCSSDGDFTAVATENKQVVLYDSNFNVIRNFVSNRAVSKIQFTLEKDLLLADKTGDVTLYKVKSEHSEVLLGHLSMLLDVKLSDCGKYVITCDRDEKIRISHYPNAYNIQSYCLGHKEFVTNIEVCGKLLISASGDGTIKFWDFLNGAVLCEIDTNKNLDDKSVVHRFCSEMDKDSVEVFALPIKDMQVCKRDNLLIVGVVLVYMRGVFLYEVENKFPQIKTRFLRSVAVEDDVLGFSLGTELFVLTEKNLECFKLTENDCIRYENLNGIHEKCKLDCLKTIDLSVLYKRKFDNVQEYLERKKQRLEGKE